jgi:hypothetical protein
VCSLLIENGRSHNVRGSALVAIKRIQLRYGCHAVVPEQAISYDTELFDCDFSSISQNSSSYSTERWSISSELHSQNLFSLLEISPRAPGTRLSI